MRLKRDQKNRTSAKSHGLFEFCCVIGSSAPLWRTTHLTVRGVWGILRGTTLLDWGSLQSSINAADHTAPPIVAGQLFILPLLSVLSHYAVPLAILSFPHSDLPPCQDTPALSFTRQSKAETTLKVSVASPSNEEKSPPSTSSVSTIPSFIHPAQMQEETKEVHSTVTFPTPGRGLDLSPSPSPSLVFSSSPPFAPDVARARPLSVAALLG